ncbi:GIY-YIG nuclease family protein [Arthrobacter sp. DNA4]|uniref:GIY-YIG nuclease family protein n=1 Tax=Arthrobacter sp. DNA4 TaxID=2963432 RepID=UPI0020CBE91B|nr:GIY-YIG nuclease family protein [Arthrobacter sp. DNA4]UTT71161.1 GIY-YIG nuclease family protein [Arthrobacter sp. DNA4]
MPKPLFRRSELIAAVQEYHRGNGGVDGKADLTTATKRALSNMARDGAIESTGVPGIWRWLVAPDPLAEAPTGLDPEDDSEELDVAEDAIEEGEGSGSVYAYYFPGYKKLADLKGDVRWPIKIGMTSLSRASIRITDQQRTVMPEEPVVAYVRRTDTPLKLERLMQAVLFYRGQQIEDAPGTEWFNSNPNEVREIVGWIFQSSGDKAWES